MPITIDKPSKYFDTVTYTGNGASPRSIGGLSFKPDFVWSKQRSVAENHNLYDAVRGGANSLRTNLTNAENASSIYGYVTSFNSDGVTYTSGGTNNDLNNANGTTFVNWNWLGANTTVSNTSGTISSTVSANTTSGFSVGKTTGTLSSGTITVGHGLGVAPSMVIWKRTDGSSNWQVYHTSTGTGLMQLNQNTPVVTSANFWPATSSTTFSVANNLYGSGETYAFYAFANVKGYSKFSSYVGNGSTSDGTFVYTGFKPAYVMVKCTTVATSTRWLIKDNKRNTYNVVANNLIADLGGTENTDANNYIDFLSNGFKCRGDSEDINSSGATYIYMAFAENPFCSSKGIPCTAR